MAGRSANDFDLNERFSSRDGAPVKMGENTEKGSKWAGGPSATVTSVKIRAGGGRKPDCGGEGARSKRKKSGLRLLPCSNDDLLQHDVPIAMAVSNLLGFV